MSGTGEHEVHASPGGDPVAAATGPYVTAPMDRLQQKFRQLAADCLCIPQEQIGVDDDLTEIGLDSVLAVEFVARVNNETGGSLTIGDLREHPTVGELAHHLEGLASGTNNAPLP